MGIPGHSRKRVNQFHPGARTVGCMVATACSRIAKVWQNQVVHRSSRTALNAGVWRYNPTQHRFEVFAQHGTAPVGRGFPTKQGDWFISACRGIAPFCNHVNPRRGRINVRPASISIRTPFDDFKNNRRSLTLWPAISAITRVGATTDAAPGSTLNTVRARRRHAHLVAANLQRGRVPRELSRRFVFSQSATLAPRRT